MKNRSESFIQKSKSMFVDRIERYRSASQQHNKSESTMQKNIVSEIFAAITAQFSELKSSSDVRSANKLTQPYIDENSSNLNVSTLNRISERFQTTSHSDSSILENMMTLSSQSESICNSIFNEQLIRSEKSVEREKSIEIYASDSRK